MKKIKKLITLAIAGTMAASFAGCNMVERTEESKGKTVLAKVGKTKITRDDVDKLLKSTIEQYKEQYGDDYESNESIKETLKKYRQNALQNLVTEEVLLQSRDKYNVGSDDEFDDKVEEQFNQVKDQNADDFDNQLEQYGYTEDSFKDYIRKSLITNQVYESMMSDIEVTDEDIENYYNDNQDTYTYDAGADVVHLLFHPEKDAQGNEPAGADEAAKAKAEAARQEVLAGKSLKEVSEEEQFKGSLYQDLGRVTFENNQMVKEFTEGFKNLPANQVSDLVKTSYGYHLIMNTAVYPERCVEPLNDSLKQTISSTLKSQKEQEAFQDKLQELKDELKVKTYEDKL